MKEWKKGFYFISLKANVPIVLVGLDYSRKTVSFLDVFYPTGEVEADMAIIQSKFAGIQGKHPERSSNS